MSHGGNDGEIVTRDGTLRVADLWEHFNGTRCPSLVGKPKLFFIQACRGLRVDPGSTLIRVNKSSSSSRYSDDRIDCHGSFSNVPDLADMLIMYSTTEGHVSFRGVEGSWFFQTLCNELNALSGDILTILTEVNRKVAFAKQSSVQEPNLIHLNKKKQMPNINSMLTKNFFLTKEALDKARGGT
jgi:caspase 7